MCCNNHGSGLAGVALEARNFRIVGKVLRCFGKRVRVLDVESTTDFFVGRWLGVHSLGSARGAITGTLVAIGMFSLRVGTRQAGWMLALLVTTRIVRHGALATLAPQRRSLSEGCI